MDRSFVELNRASTERIRRMALDLTPERMQTRVGEHWTVSIVLAHLAFWDRRVMYVLDRTQEDGKLFIPEVAVYVNDLFLPFWAAMPSSECARLSLDTAEKLDKRIEEYPENLLQEVYEFNKRWVFRALHRNNHLDEADAALKG